MTTHTTLRPTIRASQRTNLKARIRTERRDVAAVLTANNTAYRLTDGQFFCETPKSWEIWHTDPKTKLIYRVYRIARSRVMWVEEA